MSVGGQGDSFYEYLLKSYLLSGKEDFRAKQMYYAAIQVRSIHFIIDCKCVFTSFQRE